MLRGLFGLLESEIEDPEEETFLLFSQDVQVENLGFVNPKASEVRILVGPPQPHHHRQQLVQDEYVIHQSPTVLASTRPGGTTGAVLWKVSPRFASWLSEGLLFRAGSRSRGAAAPGFLDEDSCVVELGCGICPLNGMVMGPWVRKYVYTDQEYIRSWLEMNLEENRHLMGRPHRHPRPRPSGKGSLRDTPSPALVPGAGHHHSTAVQHHEADRKTRRGGKMKKQQKDRGKETGDDKGARSDQALDDNLIFMPLDWEEPNAASDFMASIPDVQGFDAVIACDCVYNYALVDPFVRTCADICALEQQQQQQNSQSESQPMTVPHRQGGEGGEGDSEDSYDDGLRRCVCIVAQQLRSDDVFLAWLKAFQERFRVWRVKEDVLGEGLRVPDGFVVHVGLLRR